MSRREYTLRDAREHQGLARESVAVAVGISSKTLERYEKANSAPRHVVLKLALIYGVAIDKIDFVPKPARRVAA